MPTNKRTTYTVEDASHCFIWPAAFRIGGERGELFANRLKSAGVDWTAAAAAVALDRSHVGPRELAPSIVLCDDWALSLVPFLGGNSRDPNALSRPIPKVHSVGLLNVILPGNATDVHWVLKQSCFKSSASIKC